MTDENTIPAADFRAQLEWEITHAVRREARFGSRRQDQRRRRVRAVIAIAVCIALGTASSFASAQVRDQSRRDSLLEAVQAELQLSMVRLDLARKIHDDVMRKVKAGIASQEELVSIDLDLKRAQDMTARLDLNIAEIKAAAQAPRDELNAPRVGGRDFVKERIDLAMADAQQKLATAEESLRYRDRQAALGLETDLVREQARLDMVRAKADLAVVAERLQLRREFLEKGTEAAALTRRLDVERLRQEIGVSQQGLDVARLRIQALQRARAAGTASELELLRAQVDLKEREQELQQLAAQLKKIGGT